jgi:hypothetical protein
MVTSLPWSFKATLNVVQTNMLSFMAASYPIALKAPKPILPPVMPTRPILLTANKIRGLLRRTRRPPRCRRLELREEGQFGWGCGGALYYRGGIATEKGRSENLSKRHTRRKFLKVVSAGTVWITLLTMPGCKRSGRTPTPTPSTTNSHAQSNGQRTRHSASAQPKYVQAFRSRPKFSPPTVDVSARAHGTAPGYIFIAPKKGAGQDGPMIIDDFGQLVWFSKNRYATDFKVQHYQGEPVLTWWEGKVVQAHGVGEYMIFDNSYREVTRVRPGNAYRGDLHEFLISTQDTALFTIYNLVRLDLSPVGGPKDGVVWQGIAQELDIESGRVLFEWHSLDHISLEESYYVLPEDAQKPFDYFHINSIDIDRDGNLLVSARNTSAVYKVERKSGEIIWRLGGKKSDFEMGPGTRFAFQHDARRQPDGTITIFDNGAAPKVHYQSRGIVLELDEYKMTATLLREYISPDKPLASGQGNMQVLPNGDVFIGWGPETFFSEFSSDGELLFNARFRGKAQSYRAFRFPWSGHPTDEPAVAAEYGSDDKVTVYASWNGATEVTIWQALAGPGPDQLKPVGFAPQDGFETTITVDTMESYVAAQAKDRSGQVLGTSKVIKPRR